ncbi:MAG: site-2 protease family protein [bacterium]
MGPINFADLILWYVAFIFSVTAHEASHALAAMKGGDLTAYLGGQVTLNPFPHIKRSPVGTVVVPLISFIWGGWMIGWASAPYSPAWADSHPRRAAWMAAAGPAANLVIASTAFVLIKIGLSLDVFSAPLRVSISTLVAAEPGVWQGAAKLLSILLMLNLILFIFNLFPFPPLDGSSVITLLMSDEMAHKFRQFIYQPAFSFLGLVLAWKFFGYIFGDVFSLVLQLLHPASRYF